MRIRLFLKSFFEGMKSVGMHISTVVNAVLLTLIYIFGVGVATFFMRIKRTSLLSVRKKSKSSYYTTKKIETEKIEDYYRQF